MHFQERRQHLKTIDEQLKKIEDILFTISVLAKNAQADGVLFRVGIQQEKIKLLRQKVQGTSERLLRREQKDQVND